MSTLSSYFRAVRIWVVIRKIKHVFDRGEKYISLKRDLTFDTGDTKNCETLLISSKDFEDRDDTPLIHAIDAWLKRIPPEIYAAHAGQSSRGALEDRVNKFLKEFG